MKRKSLVVISLLLIAISGCQETQYYPGSAQQCGPNDPVLEMQAHDCQVPNL